MSEFLPSHKSLPSSRGPLGRALVDPKEAVYVKEDFFALTGTTAAALITPLVIYAETGSSGAAVAHSPEDNSANVDISGGSSNDVAGLYMPFTIPASANNLVCEARLKVTSASASQFFVGLTESVTVANIFASGSITAAASGKDRIGVFRDSGTASGKLETFASLNAAVRNTEAIDKVTLGTSFTTFGIHKVGNLIRFYADGVLIDESDSAAHVTDAATYFCVFGSNTTTVMDVDYMLVAYDRP